MTGDFPELTFRDATNADGAGVRALVFGVLAEYGLSHDPTTVDADLDDIESSYFEPGGAFEVVAESSGRIVGTCGLLRTGADSCELRKMYLHPSLRGRGLGKRLLTRAIQRAGALGARRITLETASVLREAIALYRSFGFVPSSSSPTASRCDQAFVLDLENRSGA